MEAKASRTALSPVNFLHSAAQAMGDRTAVVHGDVRRTYAELAERAGRLASALRAAGVEEEDRVAVLCPNTPVILEAHYGVPATGAILVTINTRLSASEVGFILSDCTPRVVIVDAELAPLLEEADLGDARVVVAEDEGGDYEALLAEGDADGLAPYEGDEDAVISINYTSGTTGNPKGVVYHHRGAHLNAIGNILTWSMPRHSVYLWTLPMFHCNGWCFPWTVAANVGTNVCLRRVEAADIFRLMRSEGVTHYCGAPVVHSLLIDAPKELREGVGRVSAMVAAAAPPAAMIEGMDRLGFDLTHVYGLTETYGPACVCAKHEEWNDLDAVGRARRNGRQGVRYQLQDAMAVIDTETGRPVPADGQAVGEIVFRGNITMKGYLKNPAATQEAFDEGWFHSGDLAAVEPDGYVKIKDRAKDVIISGGENISSLEVEDVLYRHPAVAAASVVAQPDPKWGEAPLAFVELKPGSQASEVELIEYCRANLPRFMAPKGVVFGSLPKTSTGKIQKNVLRDRARSTSAID
jgi:fatty-acyl-CoA synthase